MKIYRRTIFSSRSFKTDILTGIITTFVCSFVLATLKQKIYYALLVLLVSLPVITQLFFIILDNKELIIKNGVLGFWKKKFTYDKIKKIDIGWYGGRSNVFIRIYTATKKTRPYVIDLVAEKEYNALIRDFKERGITVETIGIDKILKKYP